MHGGRVQRCRLSAGSCSDTYFGGCPLGHSCLPVVGGSLTVVSGRASVIGCSLPVDRGGLPVVGGRLTIVGGGLPLGSVEQEGGFAVVGNLLLGFSHCLAVVSCSLPFKGGDPPGVLVGVSGRLAGLSGLLAVVSCGLAVVSCGLAVDSCGLAVVSGGLAVAGGD